MDVEGEEKPKPAVPVSAGEREAPADMEKRRTIMKVQEYTEIFTAGGYNRKPGGRRPGKDPRMQLQFCWGRLCACLV